MIEVRMTWEREMDDKGRFLDTRAVFLKIGYKDKIPIKGGMDKEESTRLATAISWAIQNMTPEELIKKLGWDGRRPSQPIYF